MCRSSAGVAAWRTVRITAWCSTSPATSPATGRSMPSSRNGRVAESAVRPRSRPVPTVTASSMRRSGSARTVAICSHPQPSRSRPQASSLDILSAAESRMDSGHRHPLRPPCRSPASRRRCGSTTRSGLVTHSEWVCLEHQRLSPAEGGQLVGAAAHRACPCRSNVEEALAWTDQLRWPAEIAVRPSGRFVEIVGARF